MSSRYEIRPFSPIDIPALTHLLNDSLTYDKGLITEDYVKFRLFEDPDYTRELNLAAFDNQKVVALLSAVLPRTNVEDLQNERAWLKVFATDRRYRKKGIASQLLRSVLETLKSRGVKEVRFSDRAIWHFWPGLDYRYEDAYDFLNTFGFKRENSQVDFLYDLNEFFYPRRITKLKQELEANYIEFRRPNEFDMGRLPKWISSRFYRYWVEETQIALKRKPPTVILAIDKSNNNILGFATFNATAPGRFGPTGVDESIRKKGIGTILLFDAFRCIKNEGIMEATVHWTDLLIFYSQVPGIRGVRQYWILTLSL